MHYPPDEADPGVASFIPGDCGCPAFQLCAQGALILQVLVCHGFDHGFDSAVLNCQQQISVPLTSLPWGQAGPYSSLTMLQQMLWTYAVVLPEPVLKAR